MPEKYSICAIIVTFNRKFLLQKCINSIINQTQPLDAIVIIDNASSDGTLDSLISNGIINVNTKSTSGDDIVYSNTLSLPGNNKLSIDVFFTQLSTNTGGAGGFHEGVKRAFYKKYDLLWLMDDDVELDNNCLLTLMKSDSFNNNSILCPLIIGKQGKQLFHHKILNSFFNDNPVKIKEGIESYKIDANAFVGPLIKRTAIEKYGFPKKEYFIWADDLEYTYRIGQHEGIALVSNALIYHNDDNFIDDKVNEKAVWKYYYGARNKLDFIIINGGGALAIIVHFLVMLKTSMFLLIKQRNKKFYLPITGIYDRLNGKLGKTIDPKYFK